MFVLTRIFLLLTVLALLPLGSFTAQFGTAPHASMMLNAQAGDHIATAEASPKTFVTVLKRCKGPTLPGSPCNPALALWPVALDLAFDSPITRLHAAAWLPKPGQTPPLPIGPPRIG